MVMRDLKRLRTRRRRPIAAVLAGLAVACVLLAVRTPDGVEVLAAARDLPGGRLAAADVVVVRLPPDAVPAGAYAPGTPVSGRVLAGPLRRGELLTDARLLGSALFRQTLAGQAYGGQAGGGSGGGDPADGGSASGSAPTVIRRTSAQPAAARPRHQGRRTRKPMRRLRERERQPSNRVWSRRRSGWPIPTPPACCRRET